VVYRFILHSTTGLRAPPKKWCTRPVPSFSLVLEWTYPPYQPYQLLYYCRGSRQYSSIKSCWLLFQQPIPPSFRYLPMDWVQFSVFQLFPWIQLFHSTICKMQFDQIHSYCYFTFPFQRSQFNYQNVQRALAAFTINLSSIQFPSPLVTKPLGFQPLAVCRTPSMHLVPWKEYTLWTHQYPTISHSITVSAVRCQSSPGWTLSSSTWETAIPYRYYYAFESTSVGPLFGLNVPSFVSTSIPNFWYHSFDTLIYKILQPTDKSQWTQVLTTQYVVASHDKKLVLGRLVRSSPLVEVLDTSSLCVTRVRTQIITTHYGAIPQDADVLGRPVSSTPVVVHDTSLLCLTWVQNSHYCQYRYAQLPWWEAHSWRVCPRHTASRRLRQFLLRLTR
jgi:hypothetical protein